MKRRFWVEEEDSVLAPGLSSFLLQPISSSRTWSTLVAHWVDGVRKEKERLTAGRLLALEPADLSYLSLTHQRDPEEEIKTRC